MLLDNGLQHTHRVLFAAGVLREPRLPETLYADCKAVATHLRTEVPQMQTWLFILMAAVCRAGPNAGSKRHGPGPTRGE